MSEPEQIKPCPMKCPWCGAACGRMCCDSPTGGFRISHHWECDSLTVEGEPDQSCVCQTIVKMREEFHADLKAAQRKYPKNRLGLDWAVNELIDKYEGEVVDR